MNRREYRYEIKNSKSSAIKSDLFLKVINFHYVAGSAPAIFSGNW